MYTRGFASTGYTLLHKIAFCEYVHVYVSVMSKLILKNALLWQTIVRD